MLVLYLFKKYSYIYSCIVKITLDIYAFYMMLNNSYDWYDIDGIYQKPIAQSYHQPSAQHGKLQVTIPSKTTVIK